jgi:hypothetical protein
MRRAIVADGGDSDKFHFPLIPSGRFGLGSELARSGFQLPRRRADPYIGSG